MTLTSGEDLAMAIGAAIGSGGAHHSEATSGRISSYTVSSRCRTSPSCPSMYSMRPQVGNLYDVFPAPHPIYTLETN
ncbi:MAG: hypothetical protein JWQ75_3385 [Pseudarthrobacter sp.]|nr:hypothetical protein [Pseudarthrobacter sp.]